VKIIYRDFHSTFTNLPPLLQCWGLCAVLQCQ